MGQTKNTVTAEIPAVNRNYKSTVFAMLFGDRERLLGRPGYYRVYPGGDPEGISGEEPGGGEETTVNKG